MERSGGGRGRAVWRDSGKGGLWWGGLQLEGEGEVAAILSLSDGGGEEEILGLCCSCIDSPPPHFPRSQSNAGKSVFMYLLLLKMWRILPPWKHNKYHWSHFSLPSLCRAFAFFHSFHPPLPPYVCLTGGGTLSFLSPSLVAPRGFLMMVESCKAALGRSSWMRGIHCSRKRAVFQHPMGKGNHLEIKMRSFLQLMKEEASAHMPFWT